MVNEIGTACALKRHQPQQHDHRQLKMKQCAANESIRILERRIGDDRLAISKRRISWFKQEIHT